MKSGILRRIDDLGRIAIPKELRKQLGIKEGDTFDVSIGECGTLVLQKEILMADVSGEIDRIKNALLDCELAADVRKEAFSHLNSVESLIKNIGK